MKFSLHDIGRVTKGVGNYLEFENIEINSIKTDSRIVERGDLFVCLVGKHFDGHSFVKDAINRGAVAVLGHRPLDLKAVPYILVKDSMKALGDIARFARERFRGKVIGITGSSGKTTVKELVASVLGQKFKVGKSYKNWNNDLGVPLSVFRFNGDEDFWILELGISKKGDMERLASMVVPDIAVFVNVGLSHTEGLGDLKGVVEEKTKVLEVMSSDSMVIYNADIKELKEAISKKFKGNMIGFSTRSLEEVRFYARRQRSGDLNQIRLFLDGKEVCVEMKSVGDFWIENLLIAATVGHLMGLDEVGIKRGLTCVELPEHRWSLKKVGDFLIIDDCYNANPLSMRKSIEAASELSINKKLPLVLVLGDMKELGEKASEEHQRLGKFVKKQNVKKVFYFGEHTHDFLKGFGVDRLFERIRDEKDFRSKLISFKDSRAVFLFKGSRSCELERFIEVLLEF